jgi:hypothetical protein
VNDFSFRAKRKMNEILSKYQNLKEVTLGRKRREGIVFKKSLKRKS